ncbi:MAG TPA: PAS domain-containing protein, partial [Allosphingosinicella sp.]
MLRIDPRDLAAQGRAAAEPGDEVAALQAALAETQAALLESRRRFDHLVGNLSGVVYRSTVEAPWRMAFVSDGVRALTGYDPQALERDTAWAEIMHRDDVAQVEADIAAAVAERHSFALCYRILHRTGEARWVREQGRAVYDESGRPLFLEGVITDAGEEKRLELSLRDAEAAASRRAAGLHTMLDAVPQMIWWYDVATQRPHYSQQWATFTGIDLNAPDAPARLDYVHSDDRGEAKRRWSHSLA